MIIQINILKRHCKMVILLTYLRLKSMLDGLLFSPTLISFPSIQSQWLLVVYFLMILQQKLLFRKLMSMSSAVLQTSNLAQIYPDISEELCNKHAKLLSELKNRFSEMYDQFQPQKYVIVNGVARVVQLGAGLELSFAMQNGVTVLWRRTYSNEDIFMNGNHLEEEIIFNAKGRHTEGIHPKVDEVRDLIASIRKNAPKEKEFYGAILYIHSNIGEELYAAQEAYMLSVFIALLQVHEQLEKYSKSDILTCLLEADPSLSRKVIGGLLGDFQMGCANVELSSRMTLESQNELQLTLCDPHSDKSIKTHSSNESIKMSTEYVSFKSTTTNATTKKQIYHKTSTKTQSNDSIDSLVEEETQVNCIKVDIESSNKLIICRLDLSLEEQETHKAKVARIKELSQLVQQERLSRFDIFEEGENYLRGSAFKEMVEEEDYELLQYCEETRLLLNSLVTKKIDFAHFIAQKHDLDVKYEVFDEDVVTLVSQIHQEAPFLKNFCIIQGTALLISTDKQYYPEIIRFLRRLFNDYKLSTCRFLETHKKLPEDEKSCEIGEIMFTTSPSVGCAVYNPAENCWL